LTLTSRKCTLAISCLERGDRENNLHLQAAAAICWNREDSKGLIKEVRTRVELSKYAELTFRLQCKLFDPGQTWLGMIGYCQKWREHSEYVVLHRGMTEDDLTKGRLHLQVYRSDYTKDKFTLDQNNILKASYAHWTATKKPVFVTFSKNMYSMLRTGEFVVSGKLLSSAAMDRARTEEAWITLLKPYETRMQQVHTILFGSATKEILSETTMESRYQLSDFCPDAEDAYIIPFLETQLVQRRHNLIIVGPAGCGKSCLIQTLTMKYRVQYFGTADELREVADNVQFVVFDDFDFTNFKAEDIKRMLDRKFETQRVKVRYHDAMLSKKMTRIILCNELPECCNNDAVLDRADVVYVKSRLFPTTKRTKFRGTHLLDNETAEDHDNEDDKLFTPMAWSYGNQSRRAERVQNDFKAQLKSTGAAGYSNPHDLISAAQLHVLTQEALLDV
jgi:cytidylate kinase